MTTVFVRMRFCRKAHKITVTQKDDGDFSLEVKSNCDEVMHYAKCIGDTLTMEDLTDIRNSKIFNPENLEKITMTCLAPNGIINAAWLEAGMMSEKMANQVGSNEVRFTIDKE